MKIISILSVALLIAATPAEHKSHQHKGGNHKCNDGEQFSPKAKKCLPIEVATTESAKTPATTESAKTPATTESAKTAPKTVAATAAKK